MDGKSPNNSEGNMFAAGRARSKKKRDHCRVAKTAT